MRILDKCDDGSERLMLLVGSGLETSSDISLDVSWASARSPSVDACKETGTSAKHTRRLTLIRRRQHDCAREVHMVRQATMTALPNNTKGEGTSQCHLADSEGIRGKLHVGAMERVATRSCHHQAVTHLLPLAAMSSNKARCKIAAPTAQKQVGLLSLLLGSKYRLMALSGCHWHAE
jgi:hypothetical protein